MNMRSNKTSPNSGKSVGFQSNSDRFGNNSDKLKYVKYLPQYLVKA